MGGIEPPTSCSQNRRATAALHPESTMLQRLQLLYLTGKGVWLFSHLLSYWRVHFMLIYVGIEDWRIRLRLSLLDNIGL